MEQKYVGRDSHADAIRGALIILVVLGHFVENFRDRSVQMSLVWTFIYAFHMPLFAFVSGLFARKEITERAAESMVGRIVLPLFVFQLLYVAAAAGVKGELEPASLLRPYYALWFLLSLIVWRCLAPVLSRLPGALFVCVAIALAAGFTPEVRYALSLSRTVYFLPFFALGMLHGRSLLGFMQQARFVAAGMFVGSIAVVIAALGVGMDADVLRGSMPYEEHAILGGYPAAGRFMAMLLSACAALGFAGLVPATQRGLVWLGNRTMAVYLMHAFVVLGVKLVDRRFELGGGWAWVAVWAIVATVLSISLAMLQRPLDAAFDWLYGALRRRRNQW
jgi:fucose 4-O-acetylase-like acetyltransferase